MTDVVNDENCIVCQGQRLVDNIASGERIACRVCLGTGRGPVPYGDDLGSEARLRELRRIGELVEGRDLALSAFELVRPWFEDAESDVAALTRGMPEEKQAEYRQRIAPARQAIDAVEKMLEAEVRPR